MNYNHKKLSILSENLMNKNIIVEEKKLNNSCNINHNNIDKLFSSIVEKKNNYLNYLNSDSKINEINLEEIKSEVINDILKDETKNANKENNLKNKLNKLLEEYNQIKSELEEYKSKNLECRYRELLIDYQKIETQNNALIEQNELLKNRNEEVSKESCNYKNKYNLILKEQKKTKNLLEDISIKYNSNISFSDKFEKQKIQLENLI